MSLYRVELPAHCFRHHRTDHYLFPLGCKSFLIRLQHAVPCHRRYHGAYIAPISCLEITSAAPWKNTAIEFVFFIQPNVFGYFWATWIAAKNFFRLAESHLFDDLQADLFNRLPHRGIGANFCSVTFFANVI